MKNQFSSVSKRLRQSVVVAAGIVSSVAWAAPHGMVYTRQMQEKLAQRFNGRASLVENFGTTATPMPGRVKYYGGPVISKVKVYAVMWGDSVDPVTQAQIGDFYAAVVNSTHMDVMKMYDTTNVKSVDGRDGTGQSISRGSFGGTYVIRPSITAKALQDADIRTELEVQIASGALPKNDDDSLYMFYFPKGVSITIEGMTSCQAFCGYHEGFKSTSFGNVFYGVMPDLNAGGCMFGCGFFPTRFDALSVVSSHELIEAVTDPFPTAGDQPAFPQAWNTTDGMEVGDLCATSQNSLTSSTKKYVIQGEWDNVTGVCTDAEYHSP